MTRSMHPVDLVVAKRVRLARIEAGLSQTALGDALGVSFQQVQKYERGTNRISAGKLARIAELVGRDISYFFTRKASPEQGLLMNACEDEEASVTRIDAEIARLLLRTQNEPLKRSILSLLQTVAEPEESALMRSN